MSQRHEFDDLNLLLIAVHENRLGSPDAIRVLERWIAHSDVSLEQHIQHFLSGQTVAAHEAQLPTWENSTSEKPDATLRQIVAEVVMTPEQAGKPPTLVNHPQASGTKSSGNRQPRSSTIGNFRLLHLLGEGGMGSVWLAHQEQPVQRSVAVKLIKSAKADAATMGRFQLERQVLAMMDHANIARVFEAGTTQDGQPFVAMEYIDGVPLSNFCDEQQLSLIERLKLFIPICLAVHHAHQKGIIHRDLKPSNILVTRIDGQPVPKVIDFGLAKAVDWSGAMPGLAPATLHGEIVGTLRYMSPEQAESGNANIDTRTDIYSLGVVLYELLTGSTPLDPKTLGRLTLREIIAMICEQDAQRPSTQLGSSSKEHLQSVANQRQVSPSALRGVLSGDLDWIVMKAIHKDRQLRYESAAAFAQDIERFLNNSPIEARPPSASYRMKKFVVKHRTAVVAATLIVASLIVGIAATSFSLIEARKQRAQAQKRLEQIQKGNEILAGLFSDLDINAVNAQGEPLEAVLAERLVEAAKLLDGEAVGEPLVVAQLQTRLGESLFGLGQYAAALDVFETSAETFRSLLGDACVDTLQADHNRARALMELRQLDQAIELLIRVHQRAGQLWGEADLQTLEVAITLADAHAAAGQHTLALPMMRKNLESLKGLLPLQDQRILTTMNGLAYSLQSTGDLVQAIPLFEEVLKQRQSVLRKAHPETLVSANNLAFAYYQAERPKDAVEIFKMTYDVSLAELGPANLQTLTSQANYAKVLLDHGDIENGAKLLVESVDKQRSRYVESPARYASLQISVAVELMKFQQWLHAERLLRDSHRVRAELEPDSWGTFNVASLLGEVLMHSGKLDEAEQWLLEGYAGLEARMEKIPPAAESRVAAAIDRLIEYYQLCNRTEECQKWEQTKALNATKVQSQTEGR